MESLLARFRLAWKVLTEPDVAGEVARVLIDDIAINAVVALPGHSREQALREAVGKHARR